MDRLPAKCRRKARDTTTPWLLSEVHTRAIKRKDSTWTARSKALNALSVCANAVGENQASADALTAQIRDLTSGLASCVSDLRSALVRQSCTAIVELSAVLGGKLAEAAADELLPVLLRRAGTTKQVMRESGASAANALLSRGADGVSRVASLHLCTTVLERSVSAPIRAAAANYLGILLLKGCSSLVELGTELDNALRAGCTDADKQVREASRENLHFLKKVDITRYTTIFSTLNKKVQALVDETVNPNSQTPSIVTRPRSRVPPLQVPVRPPRLPSRRVRAPSETSILLQTPTSRPPLGPPNLDPKPVAARRSVAKTRIHTKPPQMVNRGPFVARRRETVEKRLRSCETAKLESNHGVIRINHVKSDVKQFAPRRSIPVTPQPVVPRELASARESQEGTIKHLAVRPRTRRPSAPARRTAKRAQSMVPVTAGHAAIIATHMKKTRRPTTVRPLSKKSNLSAPPKPSGTRRSVAPSTSRPWNLPPPKVVARNSRPSSSRPCKLLPPRPCSPKLAEPTRHSAFDGCDKPLLSEVALDGPSKSRNQFRCAKASSWENPKRVAILDVETDPKDGCQIAKIDSFIRSGEGTTNYENSSETAPKSEVVSMRTNLSPKLFTLDSLCSSSSDGKNMDENLAFSYVGQNIVEQVENYTAALTGMDESSSNPIRTNSGFSWQCQPVSAGIGRVRKSIATCSTHTSRKAAARAANVIETNIAHSFTCMPECNSSDAVEFPTPSCKSITEQGSPSKLVPCRHKSRISFLLGVDRTPKISPSDLARRQSDTLSETGDNNQVRLRILGNDWLQDEDASVRHSSDEHSSAVSVSKFRSLLTKKDDRISSECVLIKYPSLSQPKRRSHTSNRSCVKSVELLDVHSSTIAMENCTKEKGLSEQRASSAGFVDTENGPHGARSRLRRSIVSGTRHFGRDLTTIPNVPKSSAALQQKLGKLVTKDTSIETKHVADSVAGAKDARSKGWEERLKALEEIKEALPSVKEAKVGTIERLVDELARYINGTHVRVVSLALDVVFDLFLDTDMSKMYTVLDRRTELLTGIVNRLSERREQARLAAARALQSFCTLFDGVQQLSLLGRIHDRTQSKGRLGNEARCLLDVLQRTPEVTASARTLDSLVEVAGMAAKHRQVSVRRTGIQLSAEIQKVFKRNSVAAACERRNISLP